MDMTEAGKHWEKLNEVWQIANQNARDARFAVITAFIACANGQGVGPTAEQLAEADRLESIADKAKLEGDNLLRKVFG